jgi:hypothetical protein
MAGTSTINTKQTKYISIKPPMFVISRFLRCGAIKKIDSV